MNLAHLHLLLNHLPILGIPFSLILYVVGAMRKSNEVKRIAYFFAVGVALLTIPAYLTGEPAEKLVEHLAGVSEGLIERHEEAAEISLVLVLVSGGIAALNIFMPVGKFSRIIPTAFGLALVVSAGSLAYTGKLGGEIRHTEIRADAGNADAAASSEAKEEGKEDHDD